MNWIANDTHTLPPGASIDYKYAAGVDYVEGNDSAVRFRKGIAFIRRAASAGHEEAMAALVKLHRRNVGIGLTFRGEIQWLDKLADLAEKRFAAEMDEASGKICCDRLEQLHFAHIAYGQTESALEAAERWHRVATELADTYCSLTPLSMAELRLSDLFAYMGDMEMALMYAKAAYARMAPSCEEDPLPQRPGILACAAAERMHRLLLRLGYYPESEAAEQTQADLEARLTENTDNDPLYCQYLALQMRITFPMRSGAEDRQKQWERQLGLYRKVVSAFASYARESDRYTVKEELAEKYMELAHVHQETGYPREALELCQKAYDLWEELRNRRRKADYQYMMARCLGLQVPLLLKQYQAGQAERTAFLSCSLVAQLRDKMLTDRAKILLVSHYREICKYYMDQLLADCADNVVFKIGVLERKQKNGDGAAFAYLRYLKNLSDMGKAEEEQKHYSYAIYYYHSGILFAEHFRRNLPLLTNNLGNGYRVLIRGPVINMYQRLGRIESQLGNERAAKEYLQMAEYLRSNA